MTTRKRPQEGPMSNGNGVTATLTEDAVNPTPASTSPAAPASETQAPAALTGAVDPSQAPAPGRVARVRKTVAKTAAKTAATARGKAASAAKAVGSKATGVAKATKEKAG